jgi:class 3 adenylate cyclase
MFDDVNVAAQVGAPAGLGGIYASEAVCNQVAERGPARDRSPSPTVLQGSRAVRGRL